MAKTHRIVIKGQYVDNVTKGFKKSMKSMKSFAKGVLALAATVGAVGTGLFAIAKKAAEMGDEFDKMSGRVGASAEFLSAMAHAADLGGASIKDVETAMKRMARTASDAQVGLATAQRAFDTLGITVENADGKLKSSERLFWEIAAALKGVESETKKAALAQELFGRSGTTLLPMLNQGTEAIKEQMEEAKRLGIVFSSVAAKKSADFIDAQARMQAALKGLTNVLAKDLMPVFTDWMNRFAEWVAQPDSVDKIRSIAEAFTSLGEAVAATAKAYVWLIDISASAIEGLIMGWGKYEKGVDAANKAVIDTFSVASIGRGLTGGHGFPGMASPPAGPATVAASAPATMSFSPTVNVDARGNDDAEKLANEIAEEFGRMWFAGEHGALDWLYRAITTTPSVAGNA